MERQSGSTTWSDWEPSLKEPKVKLLLVSRRHPIQLWWKLSLASSALLNTFELCLSGCVLGT